MDTDTIMFASASAIGFFLMALGILMILTAFVKDGCGWLFFGVLAILTAMACCCLISFLTVIAGGVFGALLFAAIYLYKKWFDD